MSAQPKSNNVRTLDRSKSQINYWWENARKVNEYDYNKMISDFDWQKRHEKILNGIKNKWHAHSVMFSEKVKQMSIRNENAYRSKKQALQKKLRMKEHVLKTSWHVQQEQKSMEKKRMIEALVKKEQVAKRNVEIFLEKQESERWKIERETELKMQWHDERHKRLVEKKQDNYSQKLREIRDHFEINHDLSMKYQDEVLKKREEKSLDRFANYYCRSKEKQRERQKWRSQVKNKLHWKQERFNQLEKEQNLKRRMILRKIKNITKKREAHERERRNKIYQNKRIEWEHVEKWKLNKSLIWEENKMRREDIWYDEYQKLTRALTKDTGVDYNRRRSHMSTIASQINWDQMMKYYHKQINIIQDDSIIKKTNKERAAMYKKKLKDQEEAKEREALEKLKNPGT